MIDRARASPPVRPVATGRDDAPMKSVCPVGTRVPDDAAGAGNWIDHHMSPRAEKAPLHHARAHIRVPAHLAFSLVGLSVTGAGPGHFAFGSTGADHGLGAECKLIDTGLATLGEIFELLLDRNQEGSRHSSAAQLGNKPFLRRL